MRRIWLVFSQTVTVAVALLFVVGTFKPEWLQRVQGAGSVRVQTNSPTSSVPVSLATGGLPNQPLASAARRASPAVVSVTASRAPARNDPRSQDPWFRYFFGQQPARQEPQIGLGSGVIVSPEGYLITNNHVIEGADDIQVRLSDGREAHAKLVGTDPESDVAVLKIELDRLPAVTLGNIEQMQVGDAVLAIGNPFNVGQTVTSGIVSAMGRSGLGLSTFENFIQTDAAINPGNSGGALIDVNGNLVGINTAIYSRSGGSMGIGFAIPIDLARQVMEGLVKDGQVTRGWIGVQPRDLDPEFAQRRPRQQRRHEARRRGHAHRRQGGPQHGPADERGRGTQATLRGADRRTARRKGPGAEGDGGPEAQIPGFAAQPGVGCLPRRRSYSAVSGAWVCRMNRPAARMPSS